jgi:hypothetical protein
MEEIQTALGSVRSHTGGTSGGPQLCSPGAVQQINNFAEQQLTSVWTREIARGGMVACSCSIGPAI